MPRKSARPSRRKLRKLAQLLPLFALFASACQGILGIESWSKKPTTGPDAGSCILPSDCTGSQICLFQTCSEPCAQDKDCSSGFYCLRTDSGAACVSNDQAQCGSQECPAGTVCSDGHCQANCSAEAACPGGQKCVSGVCESTMPAGSGGTSGTGGTGGTSSNGTAGASGEVGVAGADGEAGSAGALGEAGAPSNPPDDGTAIGTVSAPCLTNGAFACAGHAQRQQLVCQEGTWHTNGACAGATRCDSTPGANAGSCQPLISECQGHLAGYRFCRGVETDVRDCGLDLVTASVVESCTFVCSAGACQGECHPDDKRCKTGTQIPQTCVGGQWQDGTTCAVKCDTTSGKCLAASCLDKSKNGDETDTDCGGSCGGCDIGFACNGDGDCVAPASARCIGLKCAAASCTDGVKNGTETDKDCGGSCAQRCAVNQGCTQNSDCLLPDSGHCTAGKCVTYSCVDNIKNGNETDKDCGGSCAADCGVGLGCGMDADCASGACLSPVCVTCKPGTKTCNGNSTQTCSTTGTWDTPVACTVTNGTGNCTGAGVCGIQSCNPGFGNCDTVVSTGCETNLNDPATCGTTCVNKLVCSSVNGTPGCSNGVCKAACSPGYGDCNVGSTNDGCEKQLNVVASCGTSCSNITTCSAPSQICMSGTCATNTPYPLGQTSTSGWSAFDPPADTWYVVPVTVPKNATLQEFRTIGVSDGGQTRLALWADDGTGHPGAYLAQSATLNVKAGTFSGAATPGGVSLTGGKTYWVGAKFVNGPHLYQSTSSGAKGYTTSQAFGSAPSLLSPFPTSPGTFSNVVLNFILLVQDIPP
jgi:hypothetical protein